MLCALLFHFFFDESKTKTMQILYVYVYTFNHTSSFHLKRDLFHMTAGHQRASKIALTLRSHDSNTER